MKNKGDSHIVRASLSVPSDTLKLGTVTSRTATGQMRRERFASRIKCGHTCTVPAIGALDHLPLRGPPRLCYSGELLDGEQ